MFVLEDQLGFNLHRVALLFRRELIRCLRVFDLTPEQWQVMATLWQQQVMTQKQIIELTLQDAPSVSRMLGRMQRKGLVRLNRTPADARAVEVQLTAAGKRMERRVPQAVLAHFAPVLSRIPDRERTDLLRSLKKIRVLLEDA
ncbi:MAG: winged helix-turn-helix transcriptional regulator [Spirochaetales bacterium]|nr:winged helix-turn-helix transcriptional regulator [Spirochaetales bacterium]